jgi:hypothetical protein
MIMDVKAKIHGANIGNRFQRGLEEGRRNMLKMITPPEMKRNSYIEQALYDQVEKYAIPDDVKYEDIVDIRELDKYHNLDSPAHPLGKVYQRQFDQKNRKNIFSINWNSGVKTMSIYKPHGLHAHQHLIINKVNSLSDNGTWNTSGNVVNLRLDELNHVSKKASIAFDINDSSAYGSIENFTMTPVDMSDYLNTGAAFSWLSIPIPSNMISVKLTLGSNQTDLATDLYYATVDQPHDNNEFVNGWNLLKYLLNTLIPVGNPNPTAISYIRFDFTTNSEAIPNCNLDSLVVRKGHIYEMTYNSAYCLIDPQTGAWKQWTTRNSDLLPFEEDTYQILMLETALAIQKDLYASNIGASFDVSGIENDLANCYNNYLANHKEEVIEPEQYTDQMGRMSYGYVERSGRSRHRDENWYEEGQD